MTMLKAGQIIRKRLGQDWLGRDARRRLAEVALTTIFPISCRVCQRLVTSIDDGVACGDCWSLVEPEFAATTRCQRCGVPTGAAGSRPGSSAGGECAGGECADFSLTGARAIGAHTGALRENVLWLKRHPWMPPRLRTLLEAAWATLPAPREFDLVLPIPLHRARQAERGFNQAELMGKVVAGRSNCRLELTSLVRIRETERHRLGIGLDERARSLSGAFMVRAPRLIAARRILLVDDVLTTGSTANEAARTLLEHGAREVWLLSLSRRLKTPRWPHGPEKVRTAVSSLRANFTVKGIDPTPELTGDESESRNR